jgi:hypothetical protein
MRHLPLSANLSHLPFRNEGLGDEGQIHPHCLALRTPMSCAESSTMPKHQVMSLRADHMSALHSVYASDHS